MPNYPITKWQKPTSIAATAFRLRIASIASKCHLPRISPPTANAIIRTGTVTTTSSTVSGQVDENGIVCNLVDLDECVQREIVTRFDLENLNMRPEFADSVPTTENLCTVVYDILKREFRQAHLERVRLEETMMNAFEYDGS